MGFKDVEKKFNAYLRKVSKVFQGFFKEVLSVLQERLNVVSMEFYVGFKVV